jgi:hypothetical protein
MIYQDTETDSLCNNVKVIVILAREITILLYRCDKHICIGHIFVYDIYVRVGTTVELAEALYYDAFILSMYLIMYVYASIHLYMHT